MSDAGELTSKLSKRRKGDMLVLSIMQHVPFLLPFSFPPFSFPLPQADGRSGDGRKQLRQTSQDAE